MQAMNKPFQFASFEFPKPVYMLPASGIPAKDQAGLKSVLLKRKESRKYVSSYFVQPTPNANGRSFYLESDFMPLLRWQYCDEISRTRIKHKGWYYNDAYDVIRGIVFRLPSNRGFIIGWTMGEQMISEIEYDVYSDEIEAARAADAFAEVAADRQREFESEDQENN